MEVSVKSGDIARENADALITAINSGGMWFGGIDGVIQRNAGNLFHAQAGSAMPLKHGQTVVAKGNDTAKTAFKNVVFVVDDLEGPLRDIVFNGLVTADAQGFKSVSIPTIRMGVMLGAVEKSLDEAISEIGEGVRRFLARNASPSLKQITFVVYNDVQTEEALKSKLSFN